MTARGKSKKLNKAWLHDHLTDPYVKLAQREGYRARAAYKLKEIDEQLADVLDRRGAERLAQLGEERFAGGAVVGEDTHLDQAVGVECRLDLAPHRVRRAVVADGDDGIEVMRLGALLLALGGAESKGSHASIIGAP